MVNVTDGFGSSILGYPRIGPHRELKRALESYWHGTLSREELLAVGREIQDTQFSELAATGLTQGAVRQIERARMAAQLLAAGDTAADVVAKLEYFDEPHLARALRSYVGRTVRQLREGAGGALALDLDQRLTS